ncbi:MAG: hypothetical protein KDB50_05390 [Mycobacterium sp.]|nr:hypothetical protein [Mycobacterium sp.]
MASASVSSVPALTSGSALASAAVYGEASCAAVAAMPPHTTVGTITAVTAVGHAMVGSTGPPSPAGPSISVYSPDTAATTLTPSAHASQPVGVLPAPTRAAMLGTPPTGTRLSGCGSRPLYGGLSVGDTQKAGAARGGGGDRWFREPNSSGTTGTTGAADSAGPGPESGAPAVTTAPAVPADLALPSVTACTSGATCATIAGQGEPSRITAGATIGTRTTRPGRHSAAAAATTVARDPSAATTRTTSQPRQHRISTVAAVTKPARRAAGAAVVSVSAVADQPAVAARADHPPRACGRVPAVAVTQEQPGVRVFSSAVGHKHAHEVRPRRFGSTVGAGHRRAQ